MASGHSADQSQSFVNPFIKAGTVAPSRAGVVVDPMPLPGAMPTLQTDISKDLLEQRATQEQAKLLERFRMLRQWQQQQQSQLIVQQQQQLDLLRNQQEMVQHALMQQRLKQWGGAQSSKPTPKSPSKSQSPGKSPSSSPARGKVQSSLPKALAQASLALSTAQSTEPAMLENLISNLNQSGSHMSQEGTDLDSENEHPGLESVEGVYPLPDTASEASDADFERVGDRHGNMMRNDESQDVESADDEFFRSVSDASVTPTASPHQARHLSVHLPDTERTSDSYEPQSPDGYPSSPPLSPQLSPFTPTSPSLRPRGGEASKGRGGEVTRGRGRDREEGQPFEERPIKSQLGVGFKTFEELVELQLKAGTGKLPSTTSAASTTSEQTSSSPRHSFLKRGQGIARFGMKQKTFKARRAPSTKPTQKVADVGEGNKPHTRAAGGYGGARPKQTQSKKKTKKKEEPPKISRKISSKQHHQPEPEVQTMTFSDDVFKRPHPIASSQVQQHHHSIKAKTRPNMSPVEREKVGVSLPHHLVVPRLHLSEGSQLEMDDTLEISFKKRAKVWEKKVEIEQEDLDEFEMLEQAADDNVSFCSEASLVVNVLQRAQIRKRELTGLSPHIKKTPLPTLHSVDAAEESDSKSCDESHDQPPDSKAQANGIDEQRTNNRMHQGSSRKQEFTVHKETIQDPISFAKSGTAEIRDDFYSSESDLEEQGVLERRDEGGEMMKKNVTRKVSKRASSSDGQDGYLAPGTEIRENKEKRTKADMFGINDSSDDDDEEEEEEEEFDLDIYRTGRNENRNNNSNTNTHFEFSLGGNQLQMKGFDKDANARNRLFEDDHRTGLESNRGINGRTSPDNQGSGDLAEDFEGTPRKLVATPESEGHAGFEDEETWGDFTAHLSDSSDEDSIVAMAPNLKLTPIPKGEQPKLQMKRKKSEKAAGEEDYQSPPPTSALVAKLFPKLRQPDTKKNKELEQQEKVLQSLSERPAAEGTQARLLRDKLNQLENEIEKFRKENLLLAKLREEREKGLESIKKEVDEFQKQKADELKRLQEFKDEETKKLKRERKVFEKHQKTLRAMPDKRDREEIEMLQNQLSDLQVELKQRESRWNASTKRLRDRTVALETENAELREEMRLLEQRRLAAWKKMESSKSKSSIPKPRPPARPTHLPIEQSNNNNINKKRPGSEDQPIAKNGESHYQHMVGNVRTVSESTDEDYLQAYPTTSMEESKASEDSKIYESRIPHPRRTPSPSDRARLPLPMPSEKTPPPARMIPSLLSPSSPSTQNTPLSTSPHHLPHPRPAASPHRTAQAGLNHGSPSREVPQPPRNGGTEDYEEIFYNDRKVEQVNSDGSRTLTFSNGTRKEISADGRSIIVSFFNGDMKQIMPDQRVVYYYSETKTTHTTYPDGLEILQFSNNQTEKHYPDGTKEITFPDQTIKYLFPNGGEESVFADGTVLRVEPNGQRIMEFPNGQREIHTEQYKRREYPDGTVKTVYPDGRQETRYSSGRLRIKDKAGNIIVDKKC